VRSVITAGGLVSETHYLGQHCERTLNSGNTKYYYIPTGDDVAGQLVADGDEDDEEEVVKTSSFRLASDRCAVLTSVLCWYTARLRAIISRVTITSASHHHKGTTVPYEEIFRSIAAEYNLDWHLLVEQAYRESRFDPLAVGKANDLGLMQVLPATWDEWAPKVGVYDPFDPASNVRVAAAYLDWIRAQLVKQGRPEPYWMLVAYNWGIGNVLKLLKAGGSWGQVPPERGAYAVDITLGAEANAVAEQMTAAARTTQG